MSPARRRDTPGRDGCGHLLLTCLGICVLLAVNGVVVAMAYTWLRRQGVQFLLRPKVAQGFLFVGPVALIFIEWWLIDLCSGYSRWRRREEKWSGGIKKG